MTKVKTNFAFHKVDVGLDVHKRSWNAAVFLDGMYIRNIHQPPSPKALHTFLATTYPGATYRCAYECGKFGYWIHRQFTNLNIQCLVINPADITTVKQQITDTWQKIQHRDFYTGCGKENCHWCEFVKTNNLAIALHDVEHEEE